MGAKNEGPPRAPQPAWDDSPSRYALRDSDAPVSGVRPRVPLEHDSAAEPAQAPTPRDRASFKPISPFVAHMTRPMPASYDEAEARRLCPLRQTALRVVTFLREDGPIEKHHIEGTEAIIWDLLREIGASRVAG